MFLLRHPVAASNREVKVKRTESVSDYKNVTGITAAALCDDLLGLNGCNGVFREVNVWFFERGYVALVKNTAFTANILFWHDKRPESLRSVIFDVCA